MSTILLTGIGGDIAQCVAAVIRESFPGVRIVGTDVHLEHGGLLSCDEFRIMPRATEDGWLGKIAGLADEVRADIIIPINESELSVLAESADRLPLDRWLMASRSTLGICLDKLATARFLETNGLSAHWTVDAALELPRSYPCIIKPRRGSGSRGVHLVTDVSEAQFHAARIPAPVFQELLLPSDRELTCAIYRTASGEVEVLQLRRRLVGGFTGWAEVVYEPSVEAVCRGIAATLSFRGSINAQLRLTSDGPAVFEINPRFSSTSLIRHRLGFQDVAWSISEMLGVPAYRRPVPPGLRAVRSQGAAIL